MKKMKMCDIPKLHKNASTKQQVNRVMNAALEKSRKMQGKKNKSKQRFVPAITE